MVSQSLPQPAALPGEGAGRVGWLERAHEWVVTVDHKKIGLMYIIYALLFLVVGGLEAVMMRIQLAVPNNHFLAPQVYSELFTMHGTTMVFFMGMPLLIGFANYMVPLQIGARDMAFPRLNAFSFWMTAFGGFLLYFSFLGGSPVYGAVSAPTFGWWAYAPLTARAFSRGHTTDYWALALIVAGIGSIGAGINLVATIFSMRCKGMTLSKMPLFVWLNLVVGGMLLGGIGPLTAAQLMLCIDRYLGGHFFDTQAGGSVVMWYHFFWIFGHPEVYILVLPAFAFASEIIPVFSRKAIFGYPVMVAATLAIAFLSFSVWAHHMFAVGMPAYGNAFFVLTSMVIGVPTGIKIFNWLGTMWGGKIIFSTAMLFCVAFIFQFLVGGLTGIMLATAPFDWQLNDSYFVVSHFHFMLVGAIVFTIFAAFYYWYPKFTGRMMSERLGKWHFWLMLIGFQLTFDPMLVSGILGMPRRVYTYMPGRGWGLWNMLSTVGAFVQGVAIAIFVVNLIRSYYRGKVAGHDPWDAWTLEWSTSSPPPVYNFATEPSVRSRRPLWDLKHPDDPDWKYE